MRAPKMRICVFILLILQTICGYAQERLTQREKDDLIEEIAKKRESVSPPVANMVKMVYSEELAAEAERQARRCDVGPFPEFPYGRIYVSGYEPIAPGESIRGLTKAKNPIFYQQLTWPTSSHIGCAKNLCRHLRYYSGSGQNVNLMYCTVLYQSYTNFKNLEGPPCSECNKDLYPTCQRNQCVPKDDRMRILRNGQAEEFTQWEKNRMLEIHNEVRRTPVYAASDMIKMAWSEKLANVAKGWAQKCDYRHPNRDIPADADFVGYGQNLAFAAGTPSIKESVQGWVAEKQYYSYNEKRCKGGVCLHYTAMAWSNTTHVGCARARCADINGEANVLYTVCQYYPQGNIGYEIVAYQTGRGCSKCDRTDYPQCDNKLCYNSRYGEEYSEEVNRNDGGSGGGTSNRGSSSSSRGSSRGGQRSQGTTNGVASAEESAQIVDLMNEARSSVRPSAANMIKLSYSERLAQEALRVACSGRTHGQYGDYSTWAFPSRNMVDEISSWAQATGQWYYKYIISAKTTEVGCVQKQCNGRKFEVRCLYSPKVEHYEEQYEQGRSCSACDSDHPACENKLCVAGRARPTDPPRRRQRAPATRTTTTTTTTAPTAAPGQGNPYVKQRQGPYKMVCRPVRR